MYLLLRAKEKFDRQHVPKKNKGLKWDRSILPQVQIRLYKYIVEDIAEIFADDDLQLGGTDIVIHTIDTDDSETLRKTKETGQWNSVLSVSTNCDCGDL